MRRLILTAMIAGMLAPAGLHAQKVYERGGKVILDLTVAAGMPAGAITTESKTALRGDDISGSGIANNTEIGTINAKVYHKLEIAPHDMNDAGEIETSNAKFTMNWVTAFNGCKNSAYDNAGWRLPTQRELQLMYIFKPALEDIFQDVSGTAFFSETMSDYWSATENNSFSWVVAFSSGNTTTTSNANTNANTTRVRCVREVE